jgi:hypothetical protein
MPITYCSNIKATSIPKKHRAPGIALVAIRREGRPDSVKLIPGSEASEHGYVFGEANQAMINIRRRCPAAQRDAQPPESGGKPAKAPRKKAA